MFKNKLFFTTQHHIHSTLNLCTTQNSNPKSRLLDHTILVDLNNLWFTSNTASSVDHTIDLLSSKRPVLISVGPAHGINLFFNICAGTDRSSTGLGNRKLKTSLQSLVLVTYFVFFFFSSQFLQQENLPLTHFKAALSWEPPPWLVQESSSTVLQPKAIPPPTSKLPYWPPPPSWEPLQYLLQILHPPHW